MRRWCPDCEEKIDYRTEEGYKKAVINNSKCSKCCKKKHPIEKLHNRFKKSAERRGKDFFITVDYLLGLWDGQDKKCYLTGTLLTDENMSIDRLDSNVDYYPGNVRLCLKQVNMTKYTLTVEEYVEITKKVSEWTSILK